MKNFGEKFKKTEKEHKMKLTAILLSAIAAQDYDYQFYDGQADTDSYQDL